MSPTDTERLTAVETRMDNVIGDIAEIKGDIVTIRDRLITRPGWGTVWALGFMGSAVVGLAVALGSKI